MAFTKILVLVLALHSCFAAPSGSEPLLDALNSHHNIALEDPSFFQSAAIQKALGEKVTLNNHPFHVDAGFVGTPVHPVGTGQILGEHVETIAIGQQAAKVGHYKNVVNHPHVQTQVINQAVQVPVQTVQTVQVPSVQYQTVQVPVKVEKEIVEVEKPVPVPHPVPVETPPKPFVKEAIYARPFQVSQKYVKTRITDIPEEQQGKVSTTTPRPTTTTTAPNPWQKIYYKDEIEENLYYANRKRKIVTRFIKIEEIYEAESFEEVGVFYTYGQNDGNNFDLTVTRIFEVDQPTLMKNETISKTTIVGSQSEASPSHIVNEHELVKGTYQIVHSYNAGHTEQSIGGVVVDKVHTERFHGSGYSKSADPFAPHRYTDRINGKQVEVIETPYKINGRRILYVEKTIRAVGDNNFSMQKIEPVPSFSRTFVDGQDVLVLTLTFDSTTPSAHSNYGVPISENFSDDFQTFLREFDQYVPSGSLLHKRLRRNEEHVEQSRKKRSVEESKETGLENNAQVTDVLHELGRRKRAPTRSIVYNGDTYTQVETVNPRDYHPGGYIYKNANGHEIKVEEEIVTRPRGPIRNEYLRYSQIFVPKEKVKYEVTGLYGQPVDSLFGGVPGSFEGHRVLGSLPFYNGFSQKYASPEHGQPFAFAKNW